MSYTEAEVSAATAAMDKYRGEETGGVGAALVVVGPSADRAAKEARIRDDRFELPIAPARRSANSPRSRPSDPGLPPSQPALRHP
jgi:hypothetical protein